MRTLLATRIKNRRKELKLSQKELAEGVCKQGQISRLENGEYTPGAELLYELSKKLKVSMDYFFDEEVPSDTKELGKFKEIARTFIAQRKYESLKYIYELEKEKIHRLSLSEKVYMEWIGSLVDFYAYERTSVAIKRLEDVLATLNQKDVNYLQVSNTLLNFYYDTENLDKFESIRKKLINQVQEFSLRTIEELEIFIKFNYNLSRYLWLQKDAGQAVRQTMKTIKICQSYRTTYLLADLFLLLGNINEILLDKTVVRGYFEIAYFLYKNIDENHEMAVTIQHYIADHFQE